MDNMYAALMQRAIHTIHMCQDPSFYTTYISGGSRISYGGGMDLRHRRFSAKMYVKTKELGPVGGGGGRAPGTPPPPDSPMYIVSLVYLICCPAQPACRSWEFRKTQLSV